MKHTAKTTIGWDISWLTDQAYRAYCLQNGEFTRSTTDFYSAIEKAGFVRRKTRSGIMVHGLSLKEGQDFLD